MLLLYLKVYLDLELLHPWSEWDGEQLEQALPAPVNEGEVNTTKCHLQAYVPFSCSNATLDTYGNKQRAWGALLWHSTKCSNINNVWGLQVGMVVLHIVLVQQVLYS